MSADPGDLVPLYTDHDGSRVRFVGGPGDGRTMSFPDHRPPPAVVLPVDVGPLMLAELLSPARPMPVAWYGPVIDELGFCSRADDGAWLYEYRGQR